MPFLLLQFHRCPPFRLSRRRCKTQLGAAGAAEEWGRLRAKQSVPVVDALLAATARVHDLTIVTRNVRDFRRVPVRVLNPMA